MFHISCCMSHISYFIFHVLYHILALCPLIINAGGTRVLAWRTALRSLHIPYYYTTSIDGTKPVITNKQQQTQSHHTI